MTPAAHEYIRSIRNPTKKLYARRYDAWLCAGAVGPEPERGTLSYMAAQAVRITLHQIHPRKEAAMTTTRTPARWLELLAKIDASTEWEGDERPGNALKSYWYPHYGSVSGAGDAATLRAMERRGLIQRQRASEYSYSITEEGILLLARIGG